MWLTLRLLIDRLSAHKSLKPAGKVGKRRNDPKGPRVFYDRLKTGEDLGNGAALTNVWMGSGNQTAWPSALVTPKRSDHVVGILCRLSRKAWFDA